MLAGGSADGAAGLVVAICESDALLTMGRFRDAAEVGLRGFRAAEQAGLSASFQATIVASNAAEALLASGHTSNAAAVIDPLTEGPPDFNDWLLPPVPGRDRHAARRHRGGRPAAAADQRVHRPLWQHRKLTAKSRNGPPNWRCGRGSPVRAAIEAETNRRASVPYATLSADERIALLAGLAAVPG